ncbi:MAG: PAS domain S-box protein, partial [Actinobacteria bacterium]|nr:PAS domain S-box protein [Actinomycetota bacterium]
MSQVVPDATWREVVAGTSPRSSWQLKGTWITVALGILILGYFICQAAGAGLGENRGLISDAISAPFGLVAAGFAIRLGLRAKMAARARAAWLVLAASFVSQWVGGLLFFLWGSGSSAGYPTWADIAYILFYPLLLASLLLLVGEVKKRAEAMNLAIDTMVLFLAGFLLLWIFLLWPVLNGSGGLPGAVSVGYALGDLLLLIGVSALAVRHELLGGSRVLASLLAGVLLVFAADLAYAHLYVSTGHRENAFLDGVYLVSWFALALAAHLQWLASGEGGVTTADGAGARHGFLVPQRAALGVFHVGKTRVLPYVSIAIALAVVIYAFRHHFATAEGAAVVVGALVVVLAVLRNLTAQREAAQLREENAARREQERFHEALKRTQFLVDHAGDSIVWIDREGRYRDVNESACRLWGYPREELLTMTAFDTDADLTRESGWWSVHWEELKERGSLTFERRERTKSGQIFPAEVSANYMEFDGQGFNCAFIRDISDRKLAEQALKRTQFLVDHAGDIIILLDSEGQIVDVNESACRELEYSRAELLRMTIFDINPDLAREPERWRIDWERLAQLGSLRIERRHRNKSGRIFPVEITVNRVEFEGKEYNCTFTRNISERKLAEETLRQSEQRLKQAQAVAHVGNWELDLATGMMWSSDEALRIIGLEGESPTRPHERIRGLHLPEDAEAAQEGLQALLRDGTPVDIVHRIRRYSDGAERVLHAKAELVRDEQGNPLKVLGVVQDVTELRAAEERLRLTQFSVDNASDYACWLNQAGDVIFVSDSACRRLGYSQEEFLRMKVFDFTSCVKPETWPQRWEELKQGRNAVVERVHFTKEGGAVPVEISTSFIEFEGREYSCGIVRDITERKQAEERLRLSESRLLRAQNVAHFGNWEVDLATVTMWSSPEARKITGIENGSEFQPLKRMELLAVAEDRLLLQRSLRALVEEEVPYDITYRLTRQNDSEERIIHSWAELIRDEQGRPTKVAGIIQEIG